MTVAALLALEDGTLMHGISVGSHGITQGEVVFNTAMTGYQEIITDPSYAQQIVTFTYPHIGNVGINEEDIEATQIWAAGIIIRDLPLLASDWRKQSDLASYLNKHKIVAIAEVDTRKLTRILRDKGALRGCIMAGEINEQKALALAKSQPSLQGLDLAKVVSVKKPYQWRQNSWDLTNRYTNLADDELSYHVVVYDFGVKFNILRLLVNRSCRITVVPAQTSAEEVLAMKPDGVVLSNGPGDPAACDYAIKATQTFLKHKMPVLGICLGMQILALASGAKTMKMKFGHHGANHPIKDLNNQRVYISSQNHGFAVDETTLPANMKITHRSLFDQSVQGIVCNDSPAFGFQGHPEASPGPHDLQYFFDDFIRMMKANPVKKKVTAANKCCEH